MAKSFYRGAFLCAILLLPALLLSPTSAKADFINGEELHIYCTSLDPNDDAICFVYITGAVDAFTTVDLIAQRTNNAEPLFCLGEDVGPEKLKQVTLRWLERPETNREFAATLLIWGALQDAFGCADKN